MYTISGGAKGLITKTALVYGFKVLVIFLPHIILTVVVIDPTIIGQTD